MPRKTEWTQRLGSAIDELRGSSFPTIDRAGLQRLLQVSPRQALRIMHQLNPHAAGHCLVIGREELIGRLEAIAAEPSMLSERARQERVTATLRQVSAAGAARRVELPAAATEPHELGSLPGSIRINPGRLEISFDGGEDLLAKLFQLAQAVASDVDRFYETVGARSQPGSDL